MMQKGHNVLLSAVKKIALTERLYYTVLEYVAILQKIKTKYLT